MTMSLVPRRLILLTLVLLFLATAISDTNPVLAGKKVKSLATDLEIAAGSSVEASVKINKPAPSKGAVVYLSSGDDSIAKVPESVFVRPGESSALFVIDTTENLTDSSIVISASYGNVGKRLTLKVKGGNPPSIRLSSLTVAPTTVSGGASAQGTVTINNAAPAGGITVALSSGNPSAVSMPASLVIPAGSTQASFTVTGSVVSTSTTASLSATYGSVKKTALLNISADFATLSSISLNPTSVVGGSSSQATVSLNIPAGFAGAVVPLSSNSSAATVPASVTVPAGAASTVFTVTTSAVSASTSATISASYGSVTRTAQLTVTPVIPVLSALVLSPISVSSGGSSQGTVILSAAAPSGSAVVSLSSSNSAATVPTSVTVAAGATTATFTVNASSVTSTRSVTIRGTYSGVTATGSLTVNPIPAASWSLALNPSSVVGGGGAQGTVTLSSAAPTGGAAISFSSNDAAVTVPSTVTVPAGATSTTFNISTTSVTSSRSVTISGVYGGMTRTGTLTVDPAPAALSTVALNPTNVVGGNASQGTVTLSSAAPSGGAVVSLSDNDSAATLPTSVTVAAGSSTATFTVSTTSVTSSRSVTISAVYSGVTRTATLTVNPVAAGLSTVSLNPTSVVGGNSSQGTVTLTAAAPTGGAVVSLSDNDSAATVPTSVTVAAGSSTATFTVNTTAVTSSRSVTVSAVYSGVTQTASLTVNPVPAALTSVSVSPTSLPGGNSSQGTVTLTAAAPTGGAVVSLSDNDAAATVPTNVTVAAGASTATFTVTTTAVTSTRSVTISAVYNGVTRTTPLTVTPVAVSLSSVALNPTSVVGGNSSQGTVTLTAAAPTGGAVVSLSDNDSAATVPTTVTVAAGSSTATFTVTTTAVPSSRSVTISAVYSGVTRTASLTVNPVPAALSSVALSPTSVVGGNSSQGTVTLTAAAPTGGAVVSLSDNDSAATVPTSVTVAAGSSTATFTVTTTAVTSSRSVTISAVYSGVTRTASLTVDPVPITVVLSSLTVNPISIIGGSSSQGTVTLTGSAPAGGAVVSLSSTAPLIASTPASVTVPQGSTSATFTINSILVVSPLLVTISASYGGVSRGIGLTVDIVGAPVAAFYVSPSGSSSGSGTLSSPWDLQTALNQPSVVQPGATIYMRGGTYKGKFKSSLNGSAASPITVRSYPGEWAVIDGYVTTTLSTSLNTTQTTLTLANASAFPNGSEVSIADQSDPGSEEQLSLNGKSGNSFSNVGRSWFGTPRLSHSVGATVVLGGNQLTINGSRCIYRDFEIKNSDPIRTQIPLNSQNSPHLRGEGLFVSGGLNRFVNLVIHDCQEGVFIGPDGFGSEVYGCIIYNNGYVAGGVYNGHGVYAIHSDVLNTLSIKESLVFNNSSLGIKDDSQNGDAVNIWHEGDVVFNNGSWPQNNNRHTGLLAASNNGIADKITVKNCFFYLPAGHSGQQLKLGIGGANNGQATVTGNYIAGGGQAIEVEKWSPLVFTGNTLHATNNQTGNSEITLYKAQSGTPSVTWNNNTYWNQISGGGGYYPAAGSSSRTFTQWKSDTTFDAASIQSVGTASTNWVFIRPNTYEIGRAHIIVYNWTGAASVTVNVAGVLAVGDSYSLYSAEALGSPVLSGTYSGGSLTVPMTSGTVAQPVGWSTSIASLRPTFGVFVLKKN
jgi:hypothetical protein